MLSDNLIELKSLLPNINFDNRVENKLQNMCKHAPSVKRTKRKLRSKDGSCQKKLKQFFEIWCALTLLVPILSESASREVWIIIFLTYIITSPETIKAVLCFHCVFINRSTHCFVSACYDIRADGEYLTLINCTIDYTWLTSYVCFLVFKYCYLLWSCITYCVCFLFLEHHKDLQ